MIRVVPVVVVIAGPPAAGTSTIAEPVAARARRPTVHLPTDSLHTWIKSGFVLPFLPESAHQNAVIENATFAAASAYLRGGYDVILDGVLGPWVIDGLRAWAAGDGLALGYLVVRPSLDVVLRRAEERAAVRWRGG